MEYFFTALGLVFIIEGIPYFVFPERMKILLKEVEAMSPEALRIMGLVFMAIGLLLCYMVRRFSPFN